MIVLFEGTPGSGKSYEAVCRILDNLRKGRDVYVHLDGMNEPQCRELIGVFTDLYGKIDDKLHYIEAGDVATSFQGLPKGAFYVLDEVQKHFGNRDWQTAKNKAFAEFCSTHRHDGQDVLLITQDIARLDTAVRSLIEWTYRFRKINFLGGAVSRKYLETVYAQDDVGGTHLSKKMKTYDAKIFRCYQSYTHQGIKEQKIVKSTNILKHPVFLCLPVLLAVGIWQLSKSSVVTGDLFATKAHAKTVEKQAEQKKVKVSPVLSLAQAEKPPAVPVPVKAPIEAPKPEPPVVAHPVASGGEVKPVGGGAVHGGEAPARGSDEEWLKRKFEEDKQRLGKAAGNSKMIATREGRIVGYWVESSP